MSLSPPFPTNKYCNEYPHYDPTQSKTTAKLEQREKVSFLFEPKSLRKATRLLFDVMEQISDSEEENCKSSGDIEFDNNNLDMNEPMPLKQPSKQFSKSTDNPIAG